MNIKKSILQYFRNKELAKLTAISLSKGLDAYERGRKCVIEKGDDGYALDCFNLAIELGVNDSCVYGLRAGCLLSLEHYQEAINDYDMSMSLDRGRAQDYHGRSIARHYLDDLDGSISDLEEAVRLSKMDNENNKQWNEYARKTLNLKTATVLYEMDLANEIRHREIKIALLKIK